MLLEVAYNPDVFAKMYSEGIFKYIFLSEEGFEDVVDMIKEQDREKVFVITDRMGTPADFDNLRIIRSALVLT